MRYGSVCSGIEAASAAWAPIGWTPAFFSEIEPFPSAVLSHHHPNTPNLGDMTKFQNWPDYAIELLVGGTPCQSFSIAGLRKGLDDPRGNLMLTYLAIAARYRPRWLVWENVAGVLSSSGGRDFGTLLGGLGQLGYGFAYRVFDAQYVRVESHPRAVPQRRRRVFVVGHLGDWRRAAAVLFERASLRGDSPPSREARKSVAGTLGGGSQSGGFRTTDLDNNGAFIPEICGTISDGAHNRGGATDRTPTPDASSLPEVAWTLQERDSKGPDSDTKEGHLIPMLRGGSFDAVGVAHSLRAEGFDASEDGTGRGTPLTVTSTGRGWWDESSVGATVRAQDSVTKADTLVACVHGTQDPCTSEHTAFALGQNNGGENAIAFQPRIARNGRGDMGDAVNALQAQSGQTGKGDSAPCIATPTAVRRLTPTECERLMGFRDGHTAIPWRGKPASECPDGPRYKALGNSMTVNCMRLIGDRIQQVEAL